ncbi:phage tail protein [Citrobacter portucalensis]|uniref:phage tail fiber protein n=1 Tax=Citrobacter portucalensis TaxID=1639133 RepID=UPI00158110D3|nr:phage tail protein [Citrobacter portucalensis]NUH52662.1 phage tail protein [Citrobacter portucalensis]
MSAGTLTLTNNDRYVTGTNTTFTTDLKAGDFIVSVVGGVTYTLPVETIDDNAGLALVSPYTGPTQSGLAWYAVPRLAMNLVTSALVTQSAEALRGLNYDKQNWQRLFSGTGDVTVKLPDGSSFTGPAWGGITATLSNISQALQGKAGSGANSDITSITGLTTPLSLKQGGTGSDNAAGSRVNLEAASIWNSFSSNIINKNIQNYPPRTGYWQAVDNQWTPKLYGGVLCFNNSGNEKNDFVEGQVSRWMFISDDNKMYLRMTYTASGQTVDTPWIAQWGQANTTIDANGALKPASPIVKIFGNGSVELNDESEGVTVKRVSTGVYLLSGVVGLNADPLWGGIDGGVVIPTDINNQPLIWADFSLEPDGDIVLKTYHRTHPGAPEFARNLIGKKNNDGSFTETVRDGEPVDIPAGRWVDVRVQMPENSLWNQKQLVIREAMEKAERERQQNQQDIQK